MGAGGGGVDVWLARIVAAGLILLAAVALAGSVVLRHAGVEAPEITGVAAGAVGALASFFAGVALGGRSAGSPGVGGGVHEDPTRAP